MHILDADVFIAAKRRYYRFSTFPVFWTWVETCCRRELACSVQPVWKEITRNEDELQAWASDLPRSVFVTCTSDPEVLGAYGELMRWAADPTHDFQPKAVREFAEHDRADAWIIAYAMAHDHTVVTNETLRPGIKVRVPIPNVCEAFGIPYVDTFDFLEALDAQFT